MQHQKNGESTQSPEMNKIPEDAHPQPSLDDVQTLLLNLNSGKLRDITIIIKVGSKVMITFNFVVCQSEHKLFLLNHVSYFPVLFQLLSYFTLIGRLSDDGQKLFQERYL